MGTQKFDRMLTNKSPPHLLTPPSPTLPSYTQHHNHPNPTHPPTNPSTKKSKSKSITYYCWLCKVVELIGRGSVIRGATLSSFPHTSVPGDMKQETK